MSTEDAPNSEQATTDSDADTPDSEQPSAESETASQDPSALTDSPGKRDVLRYVEWAGLALCVLLVIVAGLRVYSGVGAFISIWVASKFEPIVSAGFNLAVLLVAAYGAAVLSRRLTATE